MDVYLASDHAGYQHKKIVFDFLLETTEHRVHDLGPFELDPEDDYPDYISLAARAVAKDKHARAIVFGGSGQGEAMMSNRFPRVRAVVYAGGSADIVPLSREHNDANVLSIGSRFVGDEAVLEVVGVWLATEFAGEDRHIRRLKKLEHEARLGLKRLWIEYLGWAGVALIVGAYAGNVLALVSADSTAYLIANVLGSAGLAVDAFQDKNDQAVVVNVIWILVAIIGLAKFAI